MCRFELQALQKLISIAFLTTQSISMRCSPALSRRCVIALFIGERSQTRDNVPSASLSSRDAQEVMESHLQI